METAVFLTLGQAAKETGVSKATIFKALKSGKLSFVEKTQAGYKIDPAELFRVFQPGASVVRENGENERLRTAENEAETGFLRRENELLRQQLERERESADHWRRQATALLTHQPEAKPPEPEPLGAFWVSIVSIVATLSALALGAALMFHWWPSLNQP